MQKTLKFEDLKDGMIVYTYIPWGFFYKMEVIEDPDGDGYKITNENIPNLSSIPRPVFSARLESQEELNEWFYVQDKAPNPEDFEPAESHYQKNRENWIYNGFGVPGMTLGPTLTI